MKYVKCISLFIVYPLLVLGIGFYAGVKCSGFFYPREENGEERESAPQAFLDGGGQAPELMGEDGAAQNEDIIVGEEASPVLPEGMENGHSMEDGHSMEERHSTEEPAQEVMVSTETLCVDTKYVLEETDILYHTVVETTWRLPSKYVGMNREQFLQAMEVYEAFPPLSELERGFVGLEVLSFSRERVVVRMDYKFVQPSSSFYLAVYNNEVVVYLEDMQTIYIETDIQLDSLPAHLQQNIIDMMWIRDEEELYSFLENYSS